MLEADETLYARAKDGDMRAFDVLYARYEACLFGFILSQVRHHADAEDLFHETFMNAMKTRTVRFEGGGGFRAWIYRIARNLVINRARSKTRGARALAELPHAQTPEGPPSSDEAIADEEMRRALEQAVARLPPALSEVFHLRASGLRYEEIADVLECPVGTIKSRMNQMVTQLREEMRPWTVG
ncbi:MAG TPA: sigma-70 family RNA polymerase sigma factor [Polyangiaceae bacterium]|jgi:RNA polymerase sigma-70 factor (ECF subfamily)